MLRSDGRLDGDGLTQHSLRRSASARTALAAAVFAAVERLPWRWRLGGGGVGMGGGGFCAAAIGGGGFRQRRSAAAVSAVAELAWAAVVSALPR